MKQQKLFVSIFPLVLFLFIIVGCNKSVKEILESEPTDSSQYSNTNPKVLLLIIDGARGDVVKSVSPTNLRNMTYSSTCTYYSYNSPNPNAEVSISDLLTGVDSTKHHVTSDNMSGNNFGNYPTLPTRLKDLDPSNKVYAYVRNQNIAQYALNNATEKSVLNSDENIKNATINCIKTTDPTLIISEFSSIDSVGKKNGYQLSTTAYTSQITKIDEYIGNCVDALSQRANYDNENWLVVVASNKGGALPTDSSYGAIYFSNPNANGFTIFYNPKFSLTAYGQPSSAPYVGSTPIYSNATFYAKLTSTSAFDIKANNEMTIQFKMKIIALANNAYNPGILKKTSSSANSADGWWFIHNNNNGSIRFALNGVSTSSNKQLISTAVGKNEWHTYTGKVYMVGSNRFMKLFVDGVSKGDSLEVTNLDCTTATSMDLGQRGSYVSGTTSEMVTNVQIYDIAIPDDVIASYACEPELTTTYPYYSHIIGYWTCNSNGKNYIEDLTGKGNDFNFVGTSATLWNSFSDVSTNVCMPVTPDFYATNPRGLDIPYQIYTWLQYPVKSQWNLDGKAWEYNYRTYGSN